ncbi:MAG: hypothetical protein ACRDRX_04310 [Pseudonocardiaceae bacterium]
MRISRRELWAALAALVALGSWTTSVVSWMAGDRTLSTVLGGYAVLALLAALLLGLSGWGRDE